MCVCIQIKKLLKPFQNKKEQKKFRCTVFGVFFSAVNCKKDTENGAPRNYFGTSYFVTALTDSDNHQKIR